MAAPWQCHNATQTRSQEAKVHWRVWRPGGMVPVDESECGVSSWRATEAKRWCDAKWPGCLQGKVGTDSQGMLMNAKKWTGRATTVPDRPRTSKLEPS